MCSMIPEFFALILSPPEKKLPVYSATMCFCIKTDHKLTVYANIYIYVNLLKLTPHMPLIRAKLYKKII